MMRWEPRPGMSRKDYYAGEWRRARRRHRNPRIQRNLVIRHPQVKIMSRILETKEPNNRNNRTAAPQSVSFSVQRLGSTLRPENPGYSAGNTKDYHDLLGQTKIPIFREHRVNDSHEHPNCR